jgi:hypothetical protein
MNNDIPAFFEDIEPFDEISFDSLLKLTDEERQKYPLTAETHQVPDPEKFSFLQHPITFFALGIEGSGKVKSALLVIDDGAGGEKLHKDLIACNNEPDLVLTMHEDVETRDGAPMEGLQLNTYTWQLGRSSMSFSVFPSTEDDATKSVARIHLKIIE